MDKKLVLVPFLIFASERLAAGECSLRQCAAMACSMLPADLHLAALLVVAAALSERLASEEDQTNEVMHFGTRHTLLRDGMWMQPEPLLALGPNNLIGNPGNASGVYASGNPIGFEDSEGYNTLPLILRCLACTADDRKDAGDKAGEVLKAVKDKVEAIAKAEPVYTEGKTKAPLNDENSAGSRNIQYYVVNGQKTAKQVTIYDSEGIYILYLRIQ